MLVSVGPHQVITQYILAKQKNLDNKIIGVLRTRIMSDGDVINKDLEKCEEYIHGNLGINQIAHIDSVYKLWGKNKYYKFLNLPFLKRRIRKMLASTKLEIDKVENIIITAKYELGEVVFLSAFKNLKNIYFVSDGNPNLYTNPEKYKLPFYLSLFRFTNPFKSAPPIYFYKENLPDNFDNMNTKTIDDVIKEAVYNIFLTDPILRKWLDNLFGESDNNRSILLLHPLETHPSYEINRTLFLKIIKSELEKTDNTILLKHHPREKKEILNKFKKLLFTEFGERVLFFDDSYLSRMPIEIYYNRLNINRVITLFSTAALLINNAETVFYTSNSLPDSNIRTAVRNAKRFNQKVNFV